MLKFNFDDSNPSVGFGKPGGRSAPAKGPRFSLKEATDFALKHKAETFCAIVLLLTVLLLWPYLSIQMNTISSLNADLQTLLEKEKPVADLALSSKEGAALFDSLPAPLPENRFITQLTSLADKRKVTVTSVAPPETRGSSFFRTSSTQLTCSVIGFNDALLFINDIEQSPYALKVDSWKVRQSITPGSKNLEMTIVVVSTEIIGNEKNTRF